MKRIVLLGFMGAGKSLVAKHISRILKCERLDLDEFIEINENMSPADIITLHGEQVFRDIETKYLKKALETNAQVISLGGGTWLKEENRRLIKGHDCVTIWLVTNFESCWINIKSSVKKRPLAKDKRIARELFIEREKAYCLADWHLPVLPHLTSKEVAEIIIELVMPGNKGDQ